MTLERYILSKLRRRLIQGHYDEHGQFITKELEKWITEMETPISPMFLPCS